MYLNETRHSTWLELFFDLIFVVALGKVTHLFAHTHNNELDSRVFLTFIILFLPFWWIWVLHTSFSNRFDNDSRFHRIFTLLIMFVLIILSTTIDSGIDNNYSVFLMVYGIAKIITAGLYAKDIQKIKGRSINGRIIGVLAFGTTLALSGIFFSFKIAALLLTFSIIIEIIIIQTTLNSKNSTKPVDKEHLVERIGLLAIVLLGESIASLTSGLTKVDWTILTIATGLVGFSIIAMIWWIYFDSLNLLIESKRDKYGTGIIYSQLLVYMSFALLANTIRHAILNDLNLFEFRILAISGMLLLYIGKQTAYAINVPENGKYRIINTLIVLGIATASLLLERVQYILFGMAFSFAIYIVLNYKTQMKLYGKVNF
nr:MULTISPECIES: low temperature requirement protein A [unclassified Flavobacterium]